MVLSNVDIRARLLAVSGNNFEVMQAALLEGYILLSPFPAEEELERRLGAASLDLPQGGHVWRIPGSATPIDFDDLASIDRASYFAQRFDITRQVHELCPSGFVLGLSLELIALPADLQGHLFTRSTPQRWGLSVCGSAAKIDPGFIGRVVFEYQNVGPAPVLLKHGGRYGQIVFERLSSKTSKPYFLNPHASWAIGQNSPFPEVWEVVCRDSWDWEFYRVVKQVFRTAEEAATAAAHFVRLQPTLPRHGAGPGPHADPVYIQSIKERYRISPPEKEVA